MKRGYSRRKPTTRPPRTTRKEYRTNRWANVRQLVILRDKGFCRHCGESKPSKEMHVDHIEPARDRPDLFWNLDNLQLLCDSCHSKKTIAGA